MKLGVWTTCCVALLIGGCLKRQSRPRLVYVTAPPPATSVPSAQDSGTLVIEEPAPPASEEKKPTAEAPPPAPPPQTRPQKKRSGASAEPPSTEQAPDEPASIEPPPLEPADGAGGMGLRQSIETKQQDVSARLNQFEGTPVSDSERRTLGEARSFLDQSTRALKEGDLQRAERLVYKAALLMTAFEERH